MTSCKAGKFLHLREHAGAPGGEIGNLVGLEGVLVESGGIPAADAEILRGLQESGSDRQAVELRAQAIDDFRGADFAFAERFEGDEDISGVGGAATAGEGDHILNGGIFLDDFHNFLDRIVHRREGGVLRALHAAAERAGILLGKEALGDFDDQDDVERDGQEENGEREEGVVEDPVQGDPVQESRRSKKCSLAI